LLVKKAFGVKFSGWKKAFFGTDNYVMKFLHEYEVLKLYSRKKIIAARTYLLNRRTISTIPLHIHSQRDRILLFRRFLKI